MKHIKAINKEKSVPPIDNSDTSKQGKRRREQHTVEACNSKNSSVNTLLHLESTHCLAVAKGLIGLLIAMDHSCSADMFLLACKVSQLIELQKCWY